MNKRSLSKNSDQLLNVLSAAKTKFDLIQITETKQQINKDFITNVNLGGYQMYTQPSNSNAGGVVIYVNNKLDHFLRDDLSKLDDDFESVWTEIKNKKGRHSLCGCIYRHPNTDVTKFAEYIETTFTKLNNKNYNSDNSTNEFLNSMVSHSFLPYILQPTRVTDHSATVIDNIFSNITDYESYSGNTTTLVAISF